MTERYEIPSISTGDILREAVRQGAALGAKAKGFMDSGKLVPDEVMLDLIRERLSQDDVKKGFILDGFPRTVPQAEGLAGVLGDLDYQIDKVINLAVPHEVLMDRLTARRVCTKCGAVFNVNTLPPPPDGKCKCPDQENRTGEHIIQRDDDKPETVSNRLSVYNESTAPLLAYYKERGILADVAGDLPPDDVFVRVVELAG